MTDTRSYQDLSTDPPEQEPRPSDLVADDLPDVDLGAPSGRPDGRSSLDDIEEALKDVVDPELGINVVDLGLRLELRGRRFLDYRHDADLGRMPAHRRDRRSDSDGA